MRKHLALLLYLAVEHRAVHPREQLVEVDGLLTAFVIDDAPAFQHWRDRVLAATWARSRKGLLLLPGRGAAEGPGRLVGVERRPVQGPPRGCSHSPTGTD